MRKIAVIMLAAAMGTSVLTASAAKKDKKTKTVATPAEVVKLTTKADSLSYTGGMQRTEGLIPYLQQSFGVDTAHMADFVKGYQDAIAQGAGNAKLKAYSAGQQIAFMVNDRMLPYMKNEFKDATDSISDALFHKGFVAALEKDNSVIADSTAKAYFSAAVKENVNRANMALKKAGEDFLAENAKKEGVVVLPSGLQYKVITAGTGEKPKSTDHVVVKYEGKTIDGQVFDSSYKRNPQTTTFGVTQVIRGWTEALQLMPVGSKWELYIPENLAYGERGAGRDIKPYSALIFTVELVDIEKTDAQKEQKPMASKVSRLGGQKKPAARKK